MSRQLHIDIETYSPVDLRSAGLYRYAEEVELLLFAYAWDDEPVQIVDVAQGEAIPEDVIRHIFNWGHSWAHNAQFERICLSKHFNVDYYLPANNWYCTSVLAAVAGLPSNLDGASKALQLEQKKDKNGLALIKYFSIPCKATKKNGGRTRNLPQHDPAKWQLFKDYCVQDVEVERAIHKALEHIEILPEERRMYILDQYINDRGVLIDMKLVLNALAIDGAHRTRLTEEAIKITGLANPNAIGQLKAWLEEESGVEMDGVTKASVAALLPKSDGDVKRMLEIRQQLGKSSTSKYAAIARSVCKDSRIRGTLKFYGARTGRWTGQLFQVQNLPQNKLKDLDFARTLVRDNDPDLETLFGNVPATLSELIRTTIIAPMNENLTVVDFSAIEARMLAWLANEGWRIEVFKTHGKIYEASACQMFGLTMEQVTKAIRQKGKVAELALGYAGGPNALVTMGALSMGLTKEELPGLVKAWRNANKNVVKLWRAYESSFKRAIDSEGEIFTGGKCAFVKRGMWLYVTLPSGRKLSYYNPRLEDGRFSEKALCYDGVEKNMFVKIETHGGKIAENICQAACRDLLRDCLFGMEEQNLKVVMHVHDEAVIEGEPCLDLAEKIMGTPSTWADGLPLRGDGYVTEFYKKDD